jgi:hypothetical protein
LQVERAANERKRTAAAKTVKNLLVFCILVIHV